MKKVTISKGNKKMGAIPSVSLPPIITCAPGCKCAKKCYAAKLCRIYKNVKQSYDTNLECYKQSPTMYFNQIKAAACTTRFFRWHVSGDIISELYLYDMVRIAQELPGTQFLAFTKRYDIVNRFLNYESIPDNLHVIFSEWEGMDMDNPHNLPVAHVIFRGSEPDPEWKICGGNCTECACAGIGCWELKKGEHIAFYEH
jgi:hypothetical protein